MTRGETQEVPQEEGRESPDEIREQDLEAQREMEQAVEGESYVEATRTVEEAEVIEAEVVEVIRVSDAAQDQATEAKETITDVPTPVPAPGEYLDEEGSIEIAPSPEFDENPPNPPQGRIEQTADLNEGRAT